MNTNSYDGMAVAEQTPFGADEQVAFFTSCGPVHLSTGDTTFLTWQNAAVRRLPLLFRQLCRPLVFSLSF